VDAASGAVIGQTESPPEALPASFEAYTRLEIAGQHWEVVEAEPMTRVEYVKSRKLTLVLRKIKIETVPVDKILYAIPTLNDWTPAIAEGTTKLGKRVLELHEDDWRQIELVSRIHAETVESELAGVRRARESRVGPGFKAVHIRKRLTSPLAECNLTLAGLDRALSGAQPFEGLAYRQVAGLIANGFALEVDGTAVYGLISDGLVTNCGLLHLPDPPPKSIVDLCGEHGLLLVDWCAAQVY
jgi:hypothetical protein